MMSYRKKITKENNEKDSEQRNSMVFKAVGSNTNLARKRGTLGQSLFDPKSKHIKVAKHQKGQDRGGSNSQSFSRFNKAKSLERQSFNSNNVDWADALNDDPRLDMLRKASKLDDLTYEDKEELRKIFPQEMMEILEFHDYKKVIVEHLQDPDFQRLLRARFEAQEEARNARIALAAHSDHTSGGDKYASNKLPEEMNRNELEELEEITK
jgi:hypothetical protein